MLDFGALIGAHYDPPGLGDAGRVAATITEPATGERTVGSPS